MMKPCSVFQANVAPLYQFCWPLLAGCNDCGVKLKMLEVVLALISRISANSLSVIPFTVTEPLGLNIGVFLSWLCRFCCCFDQGRTDRIARFTTRPPFGRLLRIGVARP